MPQSENTVLKVLHEHDMHAFHLTGTEREGTFVHTRSQYESLPLVSPRNNSRTSPSRDGNVKAGFRRKEVGPTNFECEMKVRRKHHTRVVWCISTQVLTSYHIIFHFQNQFSNETNSRLPAETTDAY